MRRRRGWVILIVSALFVVATSPAQAWPRPGLTARVSVSSEGAQPNFGASLVSLSRNGRFAAFESDANNLVPGDTNAWADVFVRDLATNAIERVSVAGDGTQGDGHSHAPSITADGRYVAFYSTSSNLVPGDTNRTPELFTGVDAFIHDRLTGETERVSVASDGSEGNDNSFFPTISADGRFVAFSSFASNLVAGDDNARDAFSGHDVFVRDRDTNTTFLVSVASDGTQADGHALNPVISESGRYVTFDSTASTLVEGDTNRTNKSSPFCSGLDVFVRDLELGSTERVSIASDGTEGDCDALRPSVSGDGEYVAFLASSANLVPHDSNGTQDVFVHELETGITERISISSDGTESDGQSVFPSMSSDGRLVAYQSGARNLVPGDTNGVTDAFVYDRDIGVTQRVSVGPDEGQGNLATFEPALDASGRFVAFSSWANNLVAGDTNNAPDAFVRHIGPPVGVGQISATVDDGVANVSGWARFAGVVLASKEDPSDDGGPTSPEFGAELTKTEIVYRPEAEDLLFRLSVSDLPALQPVDLGSAGAPGVVYGVEIAAGQKRYEVRVAQYGPDSGAGSFGLYECASSCVRIAALPGGIGTTGDEIRVSVPLVLLGDVDGLTAVRAYSALGEPTVGPLEEIDAVDVADATFPALSVSLGIAASGDTSQVPFDISAEHFGGAFHATFSTDFLPDGEYQLLGRACLGDICATGDLRALIHKASSGG